MFGILLDFFAWVAVAVFGFVVLSTAILSFWWWKTEHDEEISKILTAATLIILIGIASIVYLIVR